MSQPHEVPPDGTDWVPRNTFAARLVWMRRELGLGQEEAAKRCNINPKTWASWELGRKPQNMAEVAQQIHEGLRTNRNWLMWGDAMNTWSSPMSLVSDPDHHRPTQEELPFAPVFSVVP